MKVLLYISELYQSTAHLFSEVSVEIKAGSWSDLQSNIFQSQVLNDISNIALLYVFYPILQCESWCLHKDKKIK